jgi:glycine dehydrogenase subunit 1
VAAVKRRCAAEGVNPGVDLEKLTGRDEDRGGLLVAITEQRSRADIDRLAKVLGAAVAAVGQQGQTARMAESAGEAVPA